MQCLYFRALFRACFYIGYAMLILPWSTPVFAAPSDCEWMITASQPTTDLALPLEIQFLNKVPAPKLFRTLMGEDVVGKKKEILEKLHQRRDRLFVEFGRQLQKQLRDVLEQSSRQDIAESAKLIATEIEGSRRPLILETWFSSPRARDAPALLELLAQQDDALNLLLRYIYGNPVWAASTKAIQLLVRQLGASLLYNGSGFFHPRCFADQVATQIFTSPSWRAAILSRPRLLAFFHRTVLAYIKTIAERQKRGFRETIHPSDLIIGWLQLEQGASFHGVLEGLREINATDAIIFAASNYDHWLNSDAFVESVPAIVRNGRMLELSQKLNESSLAASEEQKSRILSAMYEATKTSLANQKIWMLETQWNLFSKVLSSPYFVGVNEGMRIAKGLIEDESFMKNAAQYGANGDYNDRFKRWHVYFAEALAPWSKHPEAIDLVILYLEQTKQLRLMHWRTLGHPHNAIESKVFRKYDAPRDAPAPWLSHQDIGKLVNYLVTYGDFSLWSIKEALREPELQVHPFAPIWKALLEIKDERKAKEFLEKNFPLAHR